MAETRYRIARMENSQTGTKLEVRFDLNKIENISYLEIPNGKRLQVRFISGVTDEYTGSDAEEVYKVLRTI